MAEGYSYSSLEDDRDSSTTDPEHSASNKADDELCDTPLSRGAKSFSEHEVADESVPQRVHLDSFGDKKRPRQKDSQNVRSPPAKNPSRKKGMRRRRSSSKMEVDQEDSGVGQDLNFGAGPSGVAASSQSASSSSMKPPDLISSKKSSSSTNYDPKFRPGVTTGSLGQAGFHFNPARPHDSGFNQPHGQASGYNPNLRPGVTDLSEKYASGTKYISALNPGRASGSSDARGTILVSRIDAAGASGHQSSPRRRIQRQVSDDGVDADREDECPDDAACTSPNRGQKKILKMKKTLDDKFYYRSTIEPILLEASDTRRFDTGAESVDIVVLLKEKAREQLQYRSENDVREQLMHLIMHPQHWLEGIVEHRTLKSLNLVQLLISKFVLSPSKISLPSLLKGNVDPQSGARPKFQPIMYADSPFNTGDEAEQRAAEKVRRQSPKKKAEAAGHSKLSHEEMRNLERVADRLIQECSDSKSGASGSGQASYC